MTYILFWIILCDKYNILCKLFFTEQNEIMELLTVFELHEKKDKTYISLSAGEKIRVRIIVEMCRGKKILFADEILANLDVETSLKLLVCMREHAEKHGVAILMTVHNPSPEVFALVDDYFQLIKTKHTANENQHVTRIEYSRHKWDKTHHHSYKDNEGEILTRHAGTVGNTVIREQMVRKFA
eukprot:UN28719